MESQIYLMELRANLTLSARTLIRLLHSLRPSISTIKDATHVDDPIFAFTEEAFDIS